MTTSETTRVSGKSGNVSGPNFGERGEGRRSWITGEEELSTVCVISCADDLVAKCLEPGSRDHMGGLCVEEPTSS